MTRPSTGIARKEEEEKKRRRRRKKERNGRISSLFPPFSLYGKKTRGGKGEKKGDRKEIEDANGGRGVYWYGIRVEMSEQGG